MRKVFQKNLKNATTLTEINQNLFRLLEKIKNDKPEQKIGYVSGIIASDGIGHIERNIKILTQYTKQVRKLHGFPIFSAPDVLTKSMYKRLEEMRLPFLEREVKFRAFWCEIVGSGYVTDIFMTPRWLESKGSVEEFETAKKLGLKIHYVNEKQFFDKKDTPRALLA